MKSLRSVVVVAATMIVTCVGCGSKEPTQEAPQVVTPAPQVSPMPQQTVSPPVTPNDKLLTVFFPEDLTDGEVLSRKLLGHGVHHYAPESVTVPKNWLDIIDIQFPLPLIVSLLEGTVLRAKYECSTEDGTITNSTEATVIDKSVFPVFEEAIQNVMVADLLWAFAECGDQSVSLVIEYYNSRETVLLGSVQVYLLPTKQ